MSTKKKFMIFLITITSLLIIVGCSSDDKDTDNNSNQDNASDASEDINNNNNDVENNDNVESNNTANRDLDVLEEIKNVNDFYRNSYVPNTLKDEVLSDTMKVSLIEGEVIYEASSNRLLKVQDDGDGMRTNVMSKILSLDGEIRDEDYFFGNTEEVAEGAFADRSLLKWKKDDLYYSLAGGRTINSYSANEGSSEIKPEDDRLDGYKDLVKVENDLVKLLPLVDKALIPEKLPEGYGAVEIGYSEDPMRGYDAFSTELWIHYENEDNDKIYVKMYSGYDDISDSEMENDTETIEGVEVSIGSSETKFIVDDVYYEIEHKDLERDEREAFIENLLKS